MKVPCKSREEPENCASENERDFSEHSRKSSGKLRERWKNFYSQGTLFIGEGVVSRTYLDSTVARFTEDACPLWRSEGDVFTRVCRFSWKRIVRVNPFPRGASVRELGKTLPPSKCRIVKIHETSSRSSYRKKVYISEKRVEWRVLTSFGCFASFWTKHENDGRTRALCLSFRLVSGCAILVEVWNREIAEVWNQEVAEFGNQGPADLWNQRPTKLCVQIPEILSYKWWVRESEGG
jgi:hypothetical protein